LTKIQHTGRKSFYFVNIMNESSSKIGIILETKVYQKLKFAKDNFQNQISS
jgi:hypothetical protein